AGPAITASATQTSDIANTLPRMSLTEPIERYATRSVPCRAGAPRVSVAAPVSADDRSQRGERVDQSDRGRQMPWHGPVRATASVREGELQARARAQAGRQCAEVVGDRRCAQRRRHALP